MNLYTQLKGLLMVAPKDDIRYALNSIRVTDDQFAVSDGSIAIIVERRLPLNTNPPKVPSNTGEVLLDRHDLANKLKMFTAKSELDLRFNAVGQPYLQQIKDGRDLGQCVIIDTVDGTFPNLKAALKRRGKTPDKYDTIGFDLKLMAKICNAVATIAATKKFHAGRFDFYGPDGGAHINRDSINAYLMPCRL